MWRFLSIPPSTDEQGWWPTPRWALRGLAMYAIAALSGGLLFVLCAALILTDIRKLTELLGLLSGALALGWFLVREARACDADESEGTLKDFSGLLIRGNIASLGKLISSLVPALFDKVFGSKPLSWKFISRSFLATTMFGILLLVIRNPYPSTWHLGTFPSHYFFNVIVVLSTYIVNWVSFIKARRLINVIITRYYTLSATLLFVCIDGAVSYVLPFLLVIVLYFTLLLPVYGVSSNYVLFQFMAFLHLQPFQDYLFHRSENIHIITVAAPTALLTSVLTAACTGLLLVSSVIAKALIKWRSLHRVIVWWSRDVEKRPFTAIVKVARTLMIIGAVAIAA